VQTSTRGQLSSGGLLLEDRLLGGHFELVGDGRNCKAVHSSQPESLYHCQIVKLEEFQQVAEIMARMQRVASSYSAEQFALRRCQTNANPTPIQFRGVPLQ
jgi:hypothetical protein